MKGEVISSSDKTSEKPQFVPRRENFGEGDVGDKAYDIIARGAKCYAIISDGNESDKVDRCGFPATQVVDVEIGFERDYFPSCSLPHTFAIGKGLKKTIGEGKIIGLNGGKFFF